jgi:uncharacterized protein YbjT (DUF2867 family)
MRAPKILVTGGTSVLGRRGVDLLEHKCVENRVLSRGGRPGTIQGDLLTCEGLDRAVRGADAIIHCASSPFRKARRVDVEGTSRLLEAAQADVSHLVYISIVGIDRASSYPYYGIKLETEGVIEASPVPYTFLRATQFYDLVLLAMRALDRLPVMPVPSGLLGQPIDAGEVAGRPVEISLGKPAGRAPDIGGPEIRALTDAARAYLAVTGSRKRVPPVPLPGKTARAMRSGTLTCPENRYGELLWEEFLRGTVHPQAQQSRKARS